MANRIKDSSGDRTYWVQTPLLIWALTQDPYDLALWFTIKAVAGEDRECILSTEDLAVLSMMSVGKVSQCRAKLIELGLLEGEVRRDPEYPQPVWHITIPDVWETNVAWAKKHASIKAKVDHKALQKAENEKRKKSLHQVKEAQKEPSPHEGGGSPHEGGGSPHEGGGSPHEGGGSPHEATKIIYRSSIDPIQIILDPSNPPPPPLQDHKAAGGGEGLHANGLAKILNGQPPNSNGNNGHNHPATHTSAVARSPISLAMRTLASEWASDFASGWASLESDLAGWDDDQVRALLTWLFVWAIDADSQDRTLDPDRRLAAGQRYERHYANVYAGATNRIGLIKSKIKLTVAVPLTDDDAEILERRISERSFA